MIELENEENEKRIKEKKRKRISEYYDFYQGENSYFKQLQEYHNKNKNDYLKKLEENYQNVKDIDSKGLIYSDEDKNVDLAFCDEEHDNIQGLKKLIKKLITVADTKNVKKALNNLLVEIIPLTDVDGEALKSKGFNTMYDELIEMYNKRKEYVENAPYNDTDDENDESNENDLNENENKNVDKQNEKSQSKSFRLARNNLMVRFFQKQAAEMGLKLIDEDEDKLAKNASNNSDNEWENEIESEDYDLDEYTSDNENEYDDLEEGSDDVYEPESDSEDDIEGNDEFDSDNVEEDATEQQYQYELLRSDYIEKIESKLIKGIKNIEGIENIENTTEPTNSDNTKSIIRTLLKLLKNDKNKVDVIALRNLYMANMMYKENIGKSLYDVFLDNDKINEFESDIFDNESSLSDKNKNSPPTPFEFTRFIVRLFYIVQKGLAKSGFILDKLRKFPEDKFYKDLYNYHLAKDSEALGEYLGKLQSALNNAIATNTSNNNKEKEEQNKLYSTLREYTKTIIEKYSNDNTTNKFFISYVETCKKELEKLKILKPLATKLNDIFKYKDKNIK